MPLVSCPVVGHVPLTGDSVLAAPKQQHVMMLGQLRMLLLVEARHHVVWVRTPDADAAGDSGLTAAYRALRHRVARGVVDGSTRICMVRYHCMVRSYA